MLSSLITSATEFDSPRSALDYLEHHSVQRFTLPLRDLSIDTRGRLSHTGAAPLEPLQRLPLTDAALGHIDSIVGISRAYADTIEPELHAHSLNDLLRREVSAATVVVEIDHSEGTSARVAAVLRGGRVGIDHTTLLARIDARGLPAHVMIAGGEMVLRFGTGSTVEALPGDHFHVGAVALNTHWSPLKAAAQPSLELSVHLLRLVCTNGAYATRSLAEGKIFAWAGRKQIESFVDREVDRVLSFSDSALRSAVARMSETIPDESDRERITAMIQKSVGPKRSVELLADAVSTYDHFNAITAAAKDLKTEHRRRKLQVEGGRLLDRFLDAA